MTGESTDWSRGRSETDVALKKHTFVGDVWLSRLGCCACGCKVIGSNPCVDFTD